MTQNIRKALEKVNKIKRLSFDLAWELSKEDEELHKIEQVLNKCDTIFSLSNDIEQTIEEFA